MGCVRGTLDTGSQSLTALKLALQVRARHLRCLVAGVDVEVDNACICASRWDPRSLSIIDCHDHLLSYLYVPVARVARSFLTAVNIQP